METIIEKIEKNLKPGKMIHPDEQTVRINKLIRQLKGEERRHVCEIIVNIVHIRESNKTKKLYPIGCKKMKRYGGTQINLSKLHPITLGYLSTFIDMLISNTF